MTEIEIREPWKDLARLVDQGAQEELERLLKELSPRDVALAVSRLSPDEISKMFTTLAPKNAAGVLETLPDIQSVPLLENLLPAAAAAILDNLPSDERADLIADLNAADASAILEQMDPEEAADARALSQYADDVAGGLMVTEFLSFPESATVSDVIEDMRANAEKYRDYDVQYAYVCNKAGRLTGVLRLRDLLLAGGRRPISELMIPKPVWVRVETGLDDLAELFASYNFLGVPVVSDRKELLGVVLRRAVDEALSARQDSDFLKTQGIVGGEEIRTMPLARRTSRRLA